MMKDEDLKALTFSYSIQSSPRSMEFVDCIMILGFVERVNPVGVIPRERRQSRELRFRIDDSVYYPQRIHV